MDKDIAFLIQTDFFFHDYMIDLNNESCIIYWTISHS